MSRETRKNPTPRIGRKDLQDPDRDVREKKDEPEPQRSDRDAGGGRPVQLDEEGGSRRPEPASPRPSVDK